MPDTEGQKTYWVVIAGNAETQKLLLVGKSLTAKTEPEAIAEVYAGKERTLEGFTLAGFFLNKDDMEALMPAFTDSLRKVGVPEEYIEVAVGNFFDRFAYRLSAGAARTPA